MDRGWKAAVATTAAAVRTGVEEEEEKEDGERRVATEFARRSLSLSVSEGVGVLQIYNTVAVPFCMAVRSTGLLYVCVRACAPRECVCSPSPRKEARQRGMETFCLGERWREGKRLPRGCRWSVQGGGWWCGIRRIRRWFSIRRRPHVRHVCEHEREREK